MHNEYEANNTKIKYIIFILCKKNAKPNPNNK